MRHCGLLKRVSLGPKMPSDLGAPPRTGWANIVSELLVSDIGHSLAFWRGLSLATGALAAACIGALIVNYVGSMASESATFQPVWPIILGVLLLTSKGAAGVTGSGFIVLAATLATVGTVPVASIALILGVDRFMSEARALTNLVGNGVATVVIAKSEGALDEATMRRELRAGGAPALDDVSEPTSAGKA